MSDIIKLLPDSVANQIAAGEVIQRPASVVKELVENAIDAGADNITLIIKDAGRTLIQVVDNGCGMSDTDARLAFERHATSKITNADDLFALHTMGFRGEALASIAAVAQIDLRTMPHNASIGTRLTIAGSKVESQRPDACAPGSNLMVKNLFFNVPARRKFLKKDAVELSNIMKEWERLTLVNTGVSFSLIVNDVTTQQLMRGSLKQRIGQLFGKTVEKQIIPISANVDFVRISGFVGLPEHGRHRNPLQFFMVNGRNMRHPYFHKAVMSCYERLIAADVQPNYFITFEVDPSTIDVNIHPTKHEIKFENEKAIWQVLVAAVREALGKFNAVPSMDFDLADTPEIPIFNPNADADLSLNIDPNYNPFDQPDPAQPSGNLFNSGLNRDSMPASRPAASASFRTSTLGSRITDWEKLYDSFNAVAGSPLDTDSSIIDSSLDLGADIRPADGLVHVGNRYIITKSNAGLLVVDRHRAHVRVLYDYFIELVKNRRFTRQHVLFPEAITLSPAQSAMMASITPMLSDLAFDTAFLGDNTWSINAVPAEMNNANPAATIIAIIDDALNSGVEPGDAMAESVAASLARSAAVDARSDISLAEAEKLLGDLFSSKSPNFTPSGNRIIATMSVDDLAKLFS